MPKAPKAPAASELDTGTTEVEALRAEIASLQEDKAMLTAQQAVEGQVATKETAEEKKLRREKNDPFKYPKNKDEYRKLMATYRKQNPVRYERVKERLEGTLATLPD